MGASESFRGLFLGVDSDGCALDTMEARHRHCFVPAFISSFGLAPVAEAAEEAWLFVNLYSRNRGTNRYASLLRSLAVLAEHPRFPAGEGTVALPKLPALDRWVQDAPVLSAPALADAATEARRHGDANTAGELERVLAWSRAVDARCTADTATAAPFPHVREALTAAGVRADIVVVSSAPGATLRRQWADAGLDGSVREISGQEQGHKTRQLAHWRDRGGYAATAMLMLGDAPGDQRAAADVGAWFFPIVPGQEAHSWQSFVTEGLPRFLAGEWSARYQAELIEPFSRSLPQDPPWSRSD